MTIIIAFHMSNHHDFKNYYKGYISKFYRAHFPSLLSHTRFLEVMPKAIVPLFSYFSTLKGESTGIEFIDFTSIKVCHNLRVPRHKIFGVIIDTKLTTGNVHDTKPVPDLTNKLSGELYADKGYITKKLLEKLEDKGVDLITTVRRNIKEKAKH